MKFVQRIQLAVPKKFYITLHIAHHACLFNHRILLITKSFLRLLHREKTGLTSVVKEYDDYDIGGYDTRPYKTPIK